MSERVYLFPGWIRLWHWLNAALILVLAVTGLSLHFADLKLPLIGFEQAVHIHNFCGIALTVTYLFFLIANARSGNWRHFLVYGPETRQRLWTQLRWYAWGIFKGAPHPHDPSPEAPFNVLQALTYAGVMYLLMPVLIGSGIVFLYPELAPDQLFGSDGLLPIALLHYLAAMALLLFLLTHVYLGTTGRTLGQMFRAMVSGWHTH